MKASDRFMPKCADLRRSSCDLSSKCMHAKEGTIQRRPRLFARIIVVRADLFNHDLTLNAHVLWVQEWCKRHRADQPCRFHRNGLRNMDPVDRALSISPRI